MASKIDQHLARLDELKEELALVDERIIANPLDLSNLERAREIYAEITQIELELDY